MPQGIGKNIIIAITVPCVILLLVLLLVLILFMKRRQRQNSETAYLTDGPQLVARVGNMFLIKNNHNKKLSRANEDTVLMGPSEATMASRNMFNPPVNEAGSRTIMTIESQPPAYHNLTLFDPSQDNDGEEGTPYMHAVHSEPINTVTRSHQLSPVSGPPQHLSAEKSSRRYNERKAL